MKKGKSYFEILKRVRAQETTLDFHIFEVPRKKKIAARISVISAGGKSQNQRYSKIDGSWYDSKGQIVLPPGKYTIKAKCGFEYEELIFLVTLKKYESQTIGIYLHRAINMPDKGWYCGESHAHYYHVPQREDKRENSLDASDAVLMAKGEGLNYLNMANYVDKDKNPVLSADILKKTYQPFCGKDFLISWNMELPDAPWYPPGWSDPPNWALMYGHMWTIGMKDNKRFDFTDKPVCFEIHQWVHAMGGITGFTHLVGWALGWDGIPLQPVSNLAAELPFDTVTGPTYDALDIITENENMLDEQIWFCILNLGYRIPGTANTDTAFNQRCTVPFGTARTYTYIGRQKFSLGAIMGGIKKGRNMITTGPLLFMEIDGKMSGDVLEADGKKKCIKIKASIHGDSSEYLTVVQIIKNGKVIKAFDVSDKKSKTFSKKLYIEESDNAWYLSKCYGRKTERHSENDVTKSTVAYTNPVYFQNASYKKPQSASAEISCRIYDKANSKLSGTAEIWNFDKKEKEVSFKDGILKMGKVNPMARIKFRVKGYKEKEISIFREYKPLYNFIINMTQFKLTEAINYIKVREILRDVKLDCEMEKSK